MIQHSTDDGPLHPQPLVGSHLRQHTRWDGTFGQVTADELGEET